MKKSITIVTTIIVLALNTISYADDQSNSAVNVQPNVIKTPAPVNQAYQLRKPNTGSSTQAPEGPPSVEAKPNKIPRINKVPAPNKVPKPNNIPKQSAIPAPNNIPQPNAIPNTQTVINPH